MSNLLNKSGVPVKNPGDGLSHRDINNINSTVNSAIDVINLDLQDYCNLNQEVNNYSRIFTLSEAISLVPRSRRKQGLKIKYLASENPKSYHEYIFSFIGNFTDSDWENTNNWSLPFTEIDGGEWEISDNYGMSK